MGAHDRYGDLAARLEAMYRSYVACGDGNSQIAKLLQEAAGAIVELHRGVPESTGRSAEERLLDNGYDGVIYLTDFSYDDALIGVSNEDRAVYDYDLMVSWLVEREGFTEEEAIEWIDYNTIRALPYSGGNGPVILYRFFD